MKTLTVRRLEHTDFATYGQLLDEEERQLAVTLERPWLDNQHGVSCIPPGRYTASKTLSPHFGYVTPELAGVPDRADIRIHRGNLPKDSEGCILVGSAFGDFNGQKGITGSA